MSARTAVARGARNRARRGQALVEFALAAPVLLMLILGMIDFARAWNVYQVITDTARQAARQCAINQEPTPLTWDQVMTTVVNPRMGNAGLDIAAANVVPLDETRTENPAVCPATRDDASPLKAITVRIEYPYELGWIGVLVRLAGGDNVVTLTTEFTMWNE